MMQKSFRPSFAITRSGMIRYSSSDRGSGDDGGHLRHRPEVLDVRLEVCPGLLESAPQAFDLRKALLAIPDRLAKRGDRPLLPEEIVPPTGQGTSHRRQGPSVPASRRSAAFDMPEHVPFEEDRTCHRQNELAGGAPPGKRRGRGEAAEEKERRRRQRKKDAQASANPTASRNDPISPPDPVVFPPA